jgi:hypothetical protein
VGQENTDDNTMGAVHNGCSERVSFMSGHMLPSVVNRTPASRPCPFLDISAIPLSLRLFGNSAE